MSIDPNVAYWGDRCCKAEAEIERLTRERDELRVAGDFVLHCTPYKDGDTNVAALKKLALAVYKEGKAGVIASRAALEQSACQECKDELPSLNWRNGKPYSYCPECGREEDHS